MQMMFWVQRNWTLPKPFITQTQINFWHAPGFPFETKWVLSSLWVMSIGNKSQPTLPLKIGLRGTSTWLHIVTLEAEISLLKSESCDQGKEYSETAEEVQNQSKKKTFKYNVLNDITNIILFPKTFSRADTVFVNADISGQPRRWRTLLAWLQASPRRTHPGVNCIRGGKPEWADLTLRHRAPRKRERISPWWWSCAARI